MGLAKWLNHKRQYKLDLIKHFAYKNDIMYGNSHDTDSENICHVSDKGLYPEYMKSPPIQ